MTYLLLLPAIVLISWIIWDIDGVTPVKAKAQAGKIIDFLLANYLVKKKT